jgi:hypothetical protein
MGYRSDDNRDLDDHQKQKEWLREQPLFFKALHYGKIFALMSLLIFLIWQAF